MKTLFQHVVSFQCCHLGYLCDLYHAFGCYFAIEDGLSFVLNTMKMNLRKCTIIMFSPIFGMFPDAIVAWNLTTLI